MYRWMSKLVKFTGLAAHAGGAPHAGINALNAANIALTAIHAQRETFRDEDTIRVHPIITQGGVAVSSVPADVRMETFVRGRTTEAFMSASRKVDRALRAGAMAVGGGVTITTLPGYLPIRTDEALEDLYRENAGTLVGQDQVVEMGHRSGSTDMGDVSQVCPAIHPYVAICDPGEAGIHQRRFAEMAAERRGLDATVRAATAMACTVWDFLSDASLRGAAQEAWAGGESAGKRRS